MGLDQTMCSYESKHRKKTDFVIKDESTIQEIQYWRKHPYLERFMANLYISRGGKNLPFNCSKVEVLKEDLLELQALVLKDELPTGSGFFWGEDSSEYYKETDLKAIREALNEIEKGRRIYYTSWW